MKAFQSCLMLALACLLSQHSVDAAYSMAQTCVFVPNNTFIGDPNSCAGWGYCRNNQLVASSQCPNDLLFNTRTGRCDYPDNVKCASTYQEICSTLKSPQWVADPNNCQNYCYCDSTSTECQLCPPGQYFQPSTTDALPQCVWDTTFECQADSICRLVPDNTFVQNPDVCGEFLSCYNGVSQIPSGKCPTGYTYNTPTGTCSTTNSCSGQNIPPTSIGPFPQNATACEGVAAGTYIGDGQTCAGYYYCDSTNPSSNGLWGKCPMGTHFNPKATATNGQCVTPYEYICPYPNRCMNMDQLYMAQEGCLTFDYCKNQQVSYSGYKCTDVSATNPYFNEYYGTCQATIPNYPICSGTETAPAA